MNNNMTEAAMLREIIQKKDAEIDSLNALIEVIDQKRKALEEKHWNECDQLARYDDGEYKETTIIKSLLHTIDEQRAEICELKRRCDSEKAATKQVYWRPLGKNASGKIVVECSICLARTTKPGAKCENCGAETPKCCACGATIPEGLQVCKQCEDFLKDNTEDAEKRRV